MMGASQRQLQSAWAVVSTRPVIATHFARAHVLAIFYLLACPLGLVGAAYGQQSDFARNYLLVASGVALVTGVALLLAWRWFPVWSTHVLQVVGVIATGVTVSTHPRPALATGVAAFMLGAGFCAAFYNWLAASAHMALITIVGFGALTIGRPDLVIPGVMVFATIVTCGVVVGLLIRMAGNSLVDALTGLLNLQGFENKVDAVEADRSTQQGAAAVVLLDLDFLDHVNRTNGPLAGDALLRTAASEWAALVTVDQVFGRVGGDEFAVYLPETTQEDAAALVEAFRAATPDIAFSCGITSWRYGELHSTVLRRANSALYDAKRAGRNCTIFQQGIRTDLTESLRGALQREELAVHFQPIVNIAAPDTFHGVEALARWITPDGTFIPPDVFIPVAEAEGLIHDLGRFILRSAAEQLVAIRTDLGIDVNLFFNMSGLELADPSYAPSVVRILQQTGFPPDRLVVEVTETTLESQSEFADSVIATLSAHGVRIAIDDFGTGYSSLSRLHTMSVSYLKLDRSFVNDMAQEPDSPLLSVIAAMGKALKLPLIAEGVETEDQAQVLLDMGYPYAQGWLYHRAMVGDQLREELASRVVQNAAKKSTEAPAHP